jgi:hypothetical protein
MAAMMAGNDPMRIESSATASIEMHRAEPPRASCSPGAIHNWIDDPEFAERRERLTACVISPLRSHRFSFNAEQQMVKFNR